MPVRVVLCDLDDTLFDHAQATRAALAIVRNGSPDLACWPLDELDARHRVLLDTLHTEVLAGRVSIENARAERFGRLLDAAGARRTAARATAVAAQYREAYEQAWGAVPGAIELAKAIRLAGVKLSIVTNNIVAEQRIKLARCGLAPHIDRMITSEEAGMVKPDPRIFHLALADWDAAPSEAVMLGDAWGTDIEGAVAAGVRPVWLNRFGETRRDPSVAELQSLEPTADVLRALTVG